VTNPALVSTELRGKRGRARRLDCRSNGSSSLIVQRESVRDEPVAAVARFVAVRASKVENRRADCPCNDLRAKSN